MKMMELERKYSNHIIIRLSSSLEC